MGFTGPLGRAEPQDWKHVEQWPLQAVSTPSVVNKVLTLPRWHWTHDQGQEGACVGHAAAMMMALLNSERYDAFELYRSSQKVDQWPGEDYSGTSVRAAMDVLRDRGPYSLRHKKIDPAKGIAANRWARSVDELRACFAGDDDTAISIGVNWYPKFDTPIRRDRFYWLPEAQAVTSRPRGGHAVCLYGASDKRQAFRMKNSWGANYPLVWLPYSTMQRLLDENGEATIVVDK